MGLRKYLYNIVYQATVEALNAELIPRLDRLEANLNAMFDRLEARMDARFDRLEARKWKRAAAGREKSVY
ncbi:MAG: hypothetical protein LBD24_09775 [Spirochaetaceae bacterium]|jgi:hypothetical protein|nr:hypothetical protein [Spirochaetaceae bacterium]